MKTNFFVCDTIFHLTHEVHFQNGGLISLLQYGIGCSLFFLGEDLALKRSKQLIKIRWNMCEWKNKLHQRCIFSKIQLSFTKFSQSGSSYLVTQAASNPVARLTCFKHPFNIENITGYFIISRIFQTGWHLK